MRSIRKYQIFISIPDGKEFRSLYRTVLNSLTDDRIEVICYFDHPHPGDFSRQLSVSIAYSNLVVAVLTDSNPNVIYEMGLALGLGKPVIPVSDDIKNLMPMYVGRECLFYSRSKPNRDKLRLKLQERVHLLLHGQFVPLRRKTHADILTHRKNGPSSGARRPRSKGDVLEHAFAAYDKEDYELVVRLLEPEINSSLATSDHAHFYLSDAYFLISEGLPSGSRKQALLRKMLEVCDTGNRKFPNHKYLLKNLGIAHGSLGNLSFAEQIFSSQATKDPLWDLPLYNLACVHALRTELFPCLKALSGAIERDPSWRFLARIDHSFDPLWTNDLLQRLLFPMPTPEGS